MRWVYKRNGFVLQSKSELAPLRLMLRVTQKNGSLKNKVMKYAMGL